MHHNHKTLDAIIESFDSSNVTCPERVGDGKPVTIWLPLEYKAKYDLLQHRTRNKFGKVVRQMLKQALDKVRLDEGA